MDKAQARELIRVIFQNPFQRDKYEHFLRNLLNEIEPRDVHYTGNLIPDAFKEHVSQYWRIGKYVDPEGVELDLLAVEVRSFSKLDRARTALRNFAVNRLKQFEKDCSLVAFYAKDDHGADWRFSFIKIEHEAWRDEKGKVRLKTELTPARRYSYLVGVHENSHTAQNQLLDLLVMDYANPTVGQIETAFSIETVTAEFFDQYKGLYLKLYEQLQMGNRECGIGNGGEFTIHHSQFQIPLARFAKKLLGQIVFLYFLQKKGWLGLARDAKWGAGDKRFLRRLLEQARENDQNFYGSYLRYLFYEALAQERKEQDDPSYYKRFDCRIPFLNGGLFEADYDWRNIPLEIPNELFTNNEKNKAGDVGTGILDVFDRYNFTIKEDEPLEREVAVDPEMLGKVFENMLEVVERKSKGAYYTPREIVHYMCQESLIHYLDSVLNNYTPTYQEYGSQQTSLFSNRFKKGQLTLTKEHHAIKVPKADLELFVRKGHLALENDQRVLDKGKETDSYRFQLPEPVRRHARLIDEKLASIKVCDPAIGSGAFPVGLLHEIVNARLALAPHSGNPQTPYELKRHTIRESLYGVDIDASAIDIARLRLWLSLIVDEDDYSTIEALPNLDYKIVRGNSLIGFPENWKSASFDKIEGLKNDFFYETNQQKKADLKQQIDAEIQARIDSSDRIFGHPVDFDFRLFFSEVWHEKGGFDVVIGNPPYVQIQNFSGQQIQKHWEQQKYDTFAKTGDIYCLFYEKGHRILRNGGALCFISSNKWMRANYGEKLRRFLLERSAILQLIDFGDSPIFSEATTYTNILLFTKAKSAAVAKAWDLTRGYRATASLDQMLAENGQGATVFSKETFVVLPAELVSIKKHIEAGGTPLKDWDVSIYRGILTGFNQAFLIDGKKKDELIAKDPKNAEIIKPILRGRDIKRYRVDFADLWLIATFPALNIDIDDYPVVRDYLKSFGRKLHQTGAIIGKDEDGSILKSRKRTGNKWFETQDQIAYHEEFEKEKIVYAEIVYDSAFYFDASGTYPEATAFVLTGELTKYLTSLLNSELLTFVFRAFYAGGDLRGNTFRYKKVFLQNLPVIKAAKHPRCLLETLVDWAQQSHRAKSRLQSKYFEQLIDGLVYELYFPEEIKATRKDIQKHLGELAPLTDSMSQEEKLAVIQSEFDRLYDPKHPVRNHLETLDSVEVVRTIREALKK
jgi:hypothetical protein